MFKKLLGGIADSNEKQIKRLLPLVESVNALEGEMKELGDAALMAKTDEFRVRLKDGCSLDDILPEAFATVREAARRAIGLRHFDVQLMGGAALHQGRIAEMRTGEGKTLVATLPLYLNAIEGKGAHLVTVNDYLARRDPYWMGPVYHALGLSVASIYPQQNPDERTPARLYDPEYDSGVDDDPWRHFKPVSRREAYQADITYGTCAEFGFDYLRDNMVPDLPRCVQRELNYAIVDEVDNLLIDEARTPLIISAPDTEATKRYQTFARLAARLKAGVDYDIEEKDRRANLTEEGWPKLEGMLTSEGEIKEGNLYENPDLMRHVRNALQAKEFYKRDQQYVVKDGQVIIVDEFTGRMMIGRRYSEGLHQAIEAKERVPVQQESRTFATITIQNYFRMYDKLAGMTGTALTEAEEFHKIYDLDVLVIPTHRPMVRQDSPDVVYKDKESKFKAVINEIEQFHKEGRPVLVGTVSIETSEYLGGLLKKRGVPYKVLNAKQHESEAQIIAQAGRPGAVTVATNMAGRGVDIVLGGSPDSQGEGKWEKAHDNVLNLGGLHVVGTERHEARRIDNQLRGRAGRQGDPGSSRFFVSLEDDVVRRFGGDRFKGLMEWAGMDEDTPIESKMVNKAIDDSAKRVEGYHFDIRKHLVEYDDVVNQHREVIYSERRKILGGADLKQNILDMVRQEIADIVASHTQGSYDWNLEGLLKEMATVFPPPSDITAEALAQMRPKDMEAKLAQAAEALYEAREQEFGAKAMRVLERWLMLKVIDNLWVEHLTMMEHMRQGIGLMGVAQRDPLVAYKQQGHAQFQTLLDTIRHDVARLVFHARIEKKASPRPAQTQMAQIASQGNLQPTKAARVKGKKVGRNDPCPCGSGKKYKHCCGR